MRCILGEEAVSSNIAYAGNLLAAFALVPQNPGKVFDTIYRYGFIVPLMKRISVPTQRTQHGFTLVEVVAVMVIAVTLAAWVMPKMDRAGDIGTGSAANRLVAALQYAQVLAQRQGEKTRVANISSLPKVEQWNTVTLVWDTVKLQNEDYQVKLDADISISPVLPCVETTVEFAANGLPSSGSPCTFSIQNAGASFKVKIEPTGYAYLVL